MALRVIPPPLPRQPQHRGWLIAGLSVAALALIVIYGVFDPNIDIFPKCIFRLLTGYNCPGCGSQRAIHSLLNADLASAFHYNAMLVLSLPYLAAVIAAWGCTKLSATATRGRRALYALTGATAGWIIFTLLMLWWIGRNIFLPIDL